MQSKDVKSGVSNPIPAKQIVDVKLNWDCLTAPGCTTLELSLQTILDQVCALSIINDLTLNCVTVDSNNLKDILQGIINKVCSITTTTSSGTDLNLLSLNYCTPDTWDCNSSNSCITVTGCASVPTNEEIIQALVSRIVQYGNVINDLCDKITALEARLDLVDLELDNGCCDSQNLQNQINSINTQITTINTNCC
jgi:hypothetical protein